MSRQGDLRLIDFSNSRPFAVGSQPELDVAAVGMTILGWAIGLEVDTIRRKGWWDNFTFPPKAEDEQVGGSVRGRCVCATSLHAVLSFVLVFLSRSLTRPVTLQATNPALAAARVIFAVPGLPEDGPPFAIPKAHDVLAALTP